mmetsp:Transcript_5864/g.10444  ORF Transcript_5864/g.10444 Transcript_5864/m.10444 type:complete len:514 (-) Transcript_5864:171-1712(-)
MLRALLRSASSAKKVLENEFFTNPHFNRAFPHLADTVFQERGASPEDYDFIKENAEELGSEIKPEVDDHSYTSWAESLLYKKRVDVERIIDYESFEQKTFIDGYRTPIGPVKWMSQEDKNKVHKQATLKLQALEDTGLSRDEVLYKRPGGISLAEDPVFQFVKNNYAAREMLIQPGQELTVENILEAALCAKIDVDRAQVLGDDKEHLFDHELDPDYLLKKNRGLIPPDKIHPRDYYWSEDLKGKFEEFIRYKSEPRAMFPEAINKRALRRKNMRTIPEEDINYRNTEFLTQFMTEAGKIKNKYQTRLSGKIQSKVARAIKQARDMNLLPHEGMITESHKRNLVPWYIEDINRVVIHSETGTLYAKREAQTINMPRKPPTFREQSLLQEVYQDADILNARAQNLSIEMSVKSKLDKDSVTIAEARDHMRSPRKATAQSYEAIAPLVENVPADEVAEVFIKEQSMDPSLLKTAKKIPKPANVLDLWQELLELKRKMGLEAPEEVPKFVEELASP